jgi:Rieske Fe-S protein
MASALAAGALAGACGRDSGTSPSGGSAPALREIAGTLSGGRVSVTLAGSPLATNGSAALVRAGASAYLVFRSGDQAFSVLSAVCTHEGCTVSGFQNSTFVCPCHGSTFSTNGSVTRGPASRPLPSFQAQVADGVLSWSV